MQTLMTMTGLAMAMTATLGTPPAHAQAVTTAVLQPMAAPTTAQAFDWSFVAGLQIFRSSTPLAYKTLGGLSGFGGLTQYRDISPNVSIGFEYRVTPAIAMTFGVDGSYGRSDDESDHTGAATARSESFSGGLSVGANFRVLSAGRVELAITTAASAGFSGSEQSFSSDEGTTTSQSHALRIGAQAGLALDVRLLDQLWLRLSTPLVEVNYRSGTSSTDTATSADEQIQANLAVAPRLSLRADF